ncbi:MAG: accessory Sec system glycosyltransferase Asp1 [Furfurilactobacillus sp.]|jgi:poly(glycerol-phosphate) alpha-glucosyltransferase|uniref:accessory Sec system glycosyltransferase Asp1 n=1 Tax=Furfurilactobacillus TaxID=2767882 RepID=UPI001EEDA853|nr:MULTISPECIES: accessory Sec system glycosyltransferase Asp1 [Furfurilactobacillus]MCF6418656.1 accessory Sec system glycosyltransferase Asp1 [Furfurilactobacillus milii]MCH4012117.1 accessory Sec system glycosyltransferase Asp1 [Furfurilactobacillus sp.]MCH4038009.1 accessory Sec system glycosyltransferase Asp1 [Furfurilactobacillus sp.]MCH4115354.1 accessory Sec system glycosyltransferase Asp1 [Furfurilactobacillus sp.]MCI1340575.1 accessory Sec system glycosyltransferase Asp1 [Furfurilact
MIYFVDFSMPEKKSGIEHAELKRLSLFRDHGMAARLLTRDYSPRLHWNLNEAQVSDAESMNMFDYFQGALAAASQPLTMNDLRFPANHEGLDIQWHEDEGRFYVLQNGQLYRRVTLFSGTQQVSSVQLFDRFGNLYRIDHYDCRGFKTMEQYYSQDNRVDMERYLHLDGSPAIIRYLKNDAGGNEIDSRYTLVDYQGHDYDFDGMKTFLRFYLDEVAKHDPQVSVFISDRTMIDDWSISHMTAKAYKVLHLHNSQTVDANDPAHAALNYNYAYALHNLQDWDAIVTATKQQAQDVKDRFKPTIPVFTIPVGIVPAATLSIPHVPMAERTPGKVIAVARIANEKRLDDLIKAVHQARESVDNVTLDIYGYENSEDNFAEPKKIKKLIKDLDMGNVVTLKGYVPNLTPVYNSAQIFGLTSRMEGFDLALLEAVSHGVVGLAYDVNYGPAEIIENGKNGRLIDLGNWHQMADRLVKMLKNPVRLQEYSDAAYASASRFSAESVWNAWVQLLIDANSKVADKEG